MSRIFWDAMLFIYLLEDHPEFGSHVRDLLARSRRRGDQLFTSYLSLAEALAGLEPNSEAAQALWAGFTEMGFKLLPFDDTAVLPFQSLRRDFKLKQPDSLHLSCAAANNMDAFLTGDKELLKKRLQVPGIRFIVDFMKPPF